MSSPRRVLSRNAAAFLLLAMTAAAPLTAQQARPNEPRGSDAGYLAANALLGAGTAALSAAIRGENVARAALLGAGGGGVGYAGRRVAAAEFSGAGLAGRQLAATGTSIVLNAGHGRSPLSHLLLPIGPARLHLTFDHGPRLEAVRINAAEVAVLVWAISQPELSFDMEGSLRAGAPVFHADDHAIQSGTTRANGIHINGLVIIGGFRDKPVEQVLRHELVHVLQNDFVAAAWTGPVESWLVRRMPGGKRVDRFVQFGVLHALLPRPHRTAFEAEATFLEHR
jgi:hypothetical protein